MNVKATLTILLLAAVNSAAVLVQPDEPFPANRLYVASADGNRVIEIFLRELPEPVTGLPLPPGTITGLPLPTFVTGLLLPQDLAFGPDGLLYVSDSDDDVVLVFDGAGNSQGTIAAPNLQTPTGLAFGPQGDLYVASQASDTIVQFDRAGQSVGELGSASGLDDPAGIAFGPNGHLFVASHATDEVLVFDPTGVQVGSVDDPALAGPWGLAFGRGGRLYVASSATNRVLAFNKSGDLVDTLGTDALLDTPIDLTVGPDDRLYVTSAGNDLLVRFEDDGTGLIVVDPTRGLDQPRGLVFGPTLLDATIRGTLTLTGSSPSKLKERALVTVTPGSGIMTVLLEDPASPLTAIFGSDAMVFHGFDYFEDGSTRRTFQGELVHPQATLYGVGSMLLESVGKRVESEYEVRKVKGDLNRAASGGILQADVKGKAITTSTGVKGKKKGN